MCTRSWVWDLWRSHLFLASVRLWYGATALPHCCSAAELALGSTFVKQTAGCIYKSQWLFGQCEMMLLLHALSATALRFCTQRRGSQNKVSTDTHMGEVSSSTIITVDIE